jgi:hypothetical protein
MKFCLSVAKQKLQLLLTPEDLEAAKAGRCISTLEPVSGQIGLCFPGKVIFGGRDRTAISTVMHRAINPETRLTLRKAPIRGGWRHSPEISAVRDSNLGPLNWVCEMRTKNTTDKIVDPLFRPRTAGSWGDTAGT